MLKDDDVLGARSSDSFLVLSVSLRQEPPVQALGSFCMFGMFIGMMGTHSSRQNEQVFS